MREASCPRPQAIAALQQSLVGDEGSGEPHSWWPAIVASSRALIQHLVASQAYVSLGKAVMKETGNHVNSKAQRDTVLIIKSGGTAKAHQVSFVNLGGMEVLVVALSSGVQIW